MIVALPGLFSYLFFICKRVCKARFRASKIVQAPRSFSTDRSKAVSLLQLFIVYVSVVSYVAFIWHYMFLISPSFDAGGLCFVIVLFPGHLHL